MWSRVLGLSVLVVSALLSGCAKGGDATLPTGEIPSMPKWTVSAPPYSSRPGDTVDVSASATPQEAAREVLREHGASLPFWEDTIGATRNSDELSESTRRMIVSQAESLPLTTVQVYAVADAGRPSDLWTETEGTGWWLAVVGDMDLSAAFWVAKDGHAAQWKHYRYSCTDGPLFFWFGATDTLTRLGLCDGQLAGARLYVVDGRLEFLACQDATRSTQLVLSRNDGFPLQFPDTRGWVGDAPFPAQRLVDNLK